LQAASLAVVCSISQLIVTLTGGVTGLLFLKSRIENSEIVYGVDSSLWLRVLQYGVLAVLVILTLFYFRLSFLTSLVDRFQNSDRYAGLISSLKSLRATLLVKLLSLSAIRYLVFVVQYFLLFRLFGVNTGYGQTFYAVSVIFLVMAIIPTFAIAELGLRGKVSLKLLQLFSPNSLGISITTATIWFINLILPAIAGSLLIVSIKIFKNKNERK